MNYTWHQNIKFGNVNISASNSQLCNTKLLSPHYVFPTPIHYLWGKIKLFDRFLEDVHFVFRKRVGLLTRSSVMQRKKSSTLAITFVPIRFSSLLGSQLGMLKKLISNKNFSVITSEITVTFNEKEICWSRGSPYNLFKIC